ncbi:hypothetical protein [Streptomyces mirabilis]
MVALRAKALTWASRVFDTSRYEYGSATACCGGDAGDDTDDDRGGYNSGDDGVLCNGVVGLVGEVGQVATEEAAAVVGAASTASASTSVVGAAVVGVGVAVGGVRRPEASLTAVVSVAVPIARVVASSSGVTAGRGVVLAGAQVSEAGGGVLDAVDEALVAEPGAGGGLSVAGVAEGVEATAYGGLGGGVDGGFGGVVRVGDLPLEAAGAGADRDGLAGPGVVAGSGGRGGALGEVDFGVTEVERGAGVVAGEQPVAVGVVEVGDGGAVGVGGLGEVAFVVPVEASLSALAANTKCDGC